MGFRLSNGLDKVCPELIGINTIPTMDANEVAAPMRYFAGWPRLKFRFLPGWQVTGGSHLYGDLYWSRVPDAKKLEDGRRSVEHSFPVAKSRSRTSNLRHPAA
jgi:hypothetical protein